MAISIESVRGVVNGLFGDYLVATNNPLATEMCFLSAGDVIDCFAPVEVSTSATLTNRVVLFVHGLTNTEDVWMFPSRSGGESIPTDHYGRRLKDALGVTPIFVRYNSGLPIEKNGRELDRLLEGLVKHYPIEIDYLAIVGFSMGGLVSRHAQVAAGHQSRQWLKRLKQCVYIGTPHEGAPLEKLADLTGSLLSALPKTYLNHWSDWLSVRSSGIKDLKSGFAASSQCSGFADVASHYFVSGSVSSRRQSLLNAVLGDSLVRRSSARPVNRPSDGAEAHFDGVQHMGLAHNEAVSSQLLRWLRECEKVPMTSYSRPKLPARMNDPLDNLEQVSLGSAMLLTDTYKQVVQSVQTMQ